MNLQNKNSNKILLSLIGGILPAIGAVIFDAMDAGQLLPYMGVGGGSIAGGVFLACKSIKKKEYSYFAFPLIYIGALLSISGLILQCGNENQKKIFLSIFLLPLLYVTMFVFGVSILVGLLVRNRKYAKCTQPVSAKCVQIKNDIDEVGASCPVYQIYFNGTYWKVCNDEYIRMFVPQIGKTYEVYINPQRPEEFYEVRQKKWGAGISILGVVFCMAMGMCGILSLFY